MANTTNDTDNERSKNRNRSHILFLVISLIILLLGIIVNRALRREIIETRTSELESIAQLKINQISDFRNERYSEARFLEGNQTFINSVYNYLKTGNNTYANEIQDWLSPIVNNHQYRSFTIIENNTWNSLFSVGSDTMDWSRLNITKDGVQQCLNEERIVFGTLTKFQNTIFIPIFVPLIKINEGQRHKIGAVEFILDPESGFFKLIQSMPSAGKSGEILLVKRVDRKSVV